MNQQKTKKAGILKYSLIVPLALALVLSSNAENLISSAKSVLKDFKDDKKEEVVKTSITFKSPMPEKTNEETTVIPNKVDSSGIVYDVVDRMPVYPDGTHQLFNDLRNNLKYPEEAIKNKEQGQVLVEFVVSNTGKIINSVVINGISPSLDKEALRVINEMHDWIPGQNKGQKVAVKYLFPIDFNLNENLNEISIKSDKAIGHTNSFEAKTLRESFTNNNNKEDHGVSTKMSEFPGGEKALTEYLTKNIRYPDIAKNTNTYGKINVHFMINKQGKIERALTSYNEVRRPIVKGFIISNNLNYDNETNMAVSALEKEALRVVNAMPDWIPFEENGKKVAKYYTLPIQFKQEGSSNSTVYKEQAISEIIDTSKPIYFIDGKPATEIEVKALKPERIKKVNVLKDGSATAIYGSRGANGVVEIILKK